MNVNRKRRELTKNNRQNLPATKAATTTTATSTKAASTSSTAQWEEAGRGQTFWAHLRCRSLALAA